MKIKNPPFLHNPPFSPSPPFLEKIFQPYPYYQIRGTRSSPFVKGGSNYEIPFACPPRKSDEKEKEKKKWNANCKGSWVTCKCNKLRWEPRLNTSVS